MMRVRPARRATELGDSLCSLSLPDASAASRQPTLKRGIEEAPRLRYKSLRYHAPAFAL
jgi:hypothetical protein